MIQITKPIPDFETYSTVLGYSPEDSLFFDIETTGLSSASSIVFLIGCIYYDQISGKWVLSQFMAESPEEEPKLLRAFFRVSENYRTLVHFNGSTFDLPFVKNRASEHNLTQCPDKKESLDLYRIFAPLGRKCGLSQLKQISFEQFLGWNRTDQLSGKKMITLYRNFIVSRDPAIADLLLLHNHDDMLGMTILLSMSAYQSLRSGNSVSVKQIRQTESGIEMILSLSDPVPAPVILEKKYTDLLNIRLEADGASARLFLPFYQGTMLHFFKDYKNYYYLPLEDQALHKSVASFIDPAYREPARPETCYIKKSGVFLPQPASIYTPEFHIDFHSKERWFLYEQPFDTDQEQLFSLIRRLLDLMFS